MSSKMPPITQTMKDFMKNLGGYLRPADGFAGLPYTYDPLYHGPPVPPPLGPIPWRTETSSADWQMLTDLKFEQAAVRQKAADRWEAEVETFKSVTLTGWPK